MIHTYQVDGRQSSAIRQSGIWNGAVGLSLYVQRDEIRQWIVECYDRPGATECLDFLDEGRIFFLQEQDLTLFLLRWA